MKQLISDIYSLSDNAVQYSVNVKGKFTDVLSEKFMEDHELLDGIYHLLQDELSNEDKPAMSGRNLFKMSDIEEGESIDCEDMAQDIMDGYESVLYELETFLKTADIGLKTILGEKYQDIKNKITFYRNFLTKEENDND